VLNRGQLIAGANIDHAEPNQETYGFQWKHQPDFDGIQFVSQKKFDWFK
jgi:hypothetical protein